MSLRTRLLTSAALLTFALGCSQSDPGITTAVKAKFAQDDTVKAHQLDVDTSEGVVTLSGTVETTAAKDQAVLIASQTEGVRNVIDQITVSPAAATTGRFEAGGEAVREADEAVDRAQTAGIDAGITSAVKAKLLADTAVSGLKIDVDTSNSVVTLKGTVPSRSEADRAVRLARETNGVTRVVDDLRVSR